MRFDKPVIDSSYFDLIGGQALALSRVRQIRASINDNWTPKLSPLLIVNLVSCFEWFARAAIKGLIDEVPDAINRNANIIKDIKLNFATLLNSQLNQFSIGDFVALHRNFSSFEDIHNSLSDLIKQTKSSFPAKAYTVFAQRKLNDKALTKTLTKMFASRHEIVHGTPRHMLYDDEHLPFVLRRDLQAYCKCVEIYMQAFQKFSNAAIPSYKNKSNWDRIVYQTKRRGSTEERLKELEQAIEERLDILTKLEFRRAQEAWRLWREREVHFQTHIWRGGTHRNLALLGETTSINAQRIRQLEFFLRLDLIGAEKFKEHIEWMARGAPND